MDVVGGEVGQGAAAGVFELDASVAPGCGWLSPVASLQGLELGFLIGTDHIIVGTERVALPPPGIQIEHPGGLGLEIGVTGKDPGPVLPGLDRIGGQPSVHGGRRDRLGYTAGDRLAARSVSTTATTADRSRRAGCTPVP